MERTNSSIIKKVIELGAKNANVISASDIKTDIKFRKMCEDNYCGKYNKCWACPPDCGDIEPLMEKVKSYSYALVYQTIGSIEDSFDIEGMQDIARAHNRLLQKVKKEFSDMPNALHLGAGGCGVCEKCAKRDGEPCRFPNLQTVSLEAHGVDVYQLSISCGMKYTNGVNTVTYFGVMLF